MTETQAVIEEIRQSRRQMSEQCGHNSATFIEYMKKFNEKYSVQVERYCKERPAPPTDAALIGD
jgi:hypothetical protein